MDQNCGSWNRTAVRLSHLAAMRVAEFDRMAFAYSSSGIRS